MCTIRQGSMSNVLPYASPYAGNELPRSELMVNGVAALAWGEHGYKLFSVEQGHVVRLVEFPFAKSCLSRSVAGISHVWQLLQAEDRLLLLKADEEDELKVHHLVIPVHLNALIQQKLGVWDPPRFLQNQLASVKCAYHSQVHMLIAFSIFINWFWCGSNRT